ncbi:membrane protein [Clostridia bacterium]|nr:membrane protein [Clostridia bacterium]GHU73776.1 membrane protein [Clostridia bacterium]
MKLSVKSIALAGVTAALYVVLTVGFAPLSFREVQFRFSEILNLLAFINPVYAIGVTLGCFISNVVSSPFGIVDWVVGTTMTGCAVFFITRTKNLFIASLLPVLFVIPVGVEIAALSHIPLFLTVLSVVVGEFAVVTLIGYPLFRFVILKNKQVVDILKG